MDDAFVLDLGQGDLLAEEVEEVPEILTVEQMKVRVRLLVQRFFMDMEFDSMTSRTELVEGLSDLRNKRVERDGSIIRRPAQFWNKEEKTCQQEKTD